MIRAQILVEYHSVIDIPIVSHYWSKKMMACITVLLQKNITVAIIIIIISNDSLTCCCPHCLRNKVKENIFVNQYTVH